VKWISNSWYAKSTINIKYRVKYVFNLYFYGEFWFRPCKINNLFFIPTNFFLLFLILNGNFFGIFCYFFNIIRHI
jgi:hypothetical protein